MTQEFRDFRLQPAARTLWRRAADELLIDAIFGDVLLLRPDETGGTRPHPIPAPERSPGWTGTPSSLALEP